MQKQSMKRRIAAAMQYRDYQVTENINNGALVTACYYGHIEIVKYLIKKGADVNFKNKHGLTALHAACATGNFELAELLIFFKAKVEVFDNHNKTPSDWLEPKHENIKSLLLHHKYIQKYSDKK